jgi:phosphatidylglycerophosphate synthase
MIYAIITAVFILLFFGISELLNWFDGAVERKREKRMNYERIEKPK